MPRSSSRHKREMQDIDSAGETAAEHNETWNNPRPPPPEPPEAAGTEECK